MDLQTKDRATKIKFRFLVFAFLTVALVAFLFLTDFVKQKEVPIAVIIIGALVYGYYYLKKYTYIQYIDDNNKIILRYFNIVPSTLDHHAIEITKQNFIGFKVKQSFFSLREEIILTAKTRNGIANYPPVCITILNDAEKKLVLNSLTKIANSNKKK